MAIIRDIVSREIFKDYEIPEELGKRFEMILVPISNTEDVNNDIFNNGIIQYTTENGFLRNLLAEGSEDIWNDI